ncbi:26S proteasome non-ATPase regulatory subunit [Spironucleus salmonicida]|uniref:26S proteasome non-ATPase regulatory subunit n=1 Tax=Spironucleus salmonicida TaxID=348837 RepID=V6LX56_9EUKA|nr:26S proteasome non-ATPase regulatory subunit [Spironucleus salmonicida]|eukprot:EST49202.1 26S proteasome non-ATPase regulatory subunit [Spironucleus salmonicida]
MDVTIQLQPTVLFQIADHRRRYVDSDTNKQRVIGCLMGYSDQVIQISNSFPIPFEEKRDLTYLDLEYAKNLIYMFRKVYPEEIFLGFYSTKPLQESDAALLTLFQAIEDTPIMLTVDCAPGDDLQPFFKVYRQNKLVNCDLHWSEVEKVVLSDKVPKRDFQTIVESLSILQQELNLILSQKDDFDQAMFEKVQEILNAAAIVEKEILIKRANDYSVARTVAELARLVVMIKKNQ